MKARREHGVTVLVCLIMMLLVMLLGASAARLSLQGEQAVRGLRERETAFQAAQDALVDAERDLRNGSATVAAGACAVAPVWQRVDISGSADGGACSTAYGARTGAVMRTGTGLLPLQPPRYLIEALDCHQPGHSATAPSPCYRITAIGFGPRPGVEVVLQSVYIPE
ncbi:MAG: pilus assembly protein PilX [Duganella sp.]